MTFKNSFSADTVPSSRSPQSQGDGRAYARYMPEIDGLRAIAVLAVVVYHMGVGVLGGGFVGVDIFFVISGFVVASSVRDGAFPRLRDFMLFFYARRIVRIMPALILCVLVTSIFVALFVPSIWLSSSINRTGLFAILGASNIYLAFNDDKYFSPVAEFNPFTHTWSLGVEEQFYLIFPLLWFLVVRAGAGGGVRRTVVGAIAVLSLVSLAVAAVLTRSQPDHAFYLIVSRFWELGVGVVLSATLPAWTALIGRLSPATRGAALAASVAGLVASLLFADARLFPFPWALLPVVSTAVLIALVVARPQSIAGRVLASGPMVFVGKRSYSLYLWHWPVFVLARWTFGMGTPTTSVLALALTAILALVAYELVEQPLRQHPLVRRAPRWQVVGVGVLLIGLGFAATATVLRAKRYVLLSSTKAEDVWFPNKPLDATGRCAADVSTAPFAGGGVTTVSSACAATPARTLFVFGDSHSTAYLPLLSTAASRQGYTVRIYTRPDCSFFNLMLPNAETLPACDAFAKAAVAAVAASATAQDVLFLPSLRVPRYRNQWGGAELLPVDDSPAAREKQARAIVEMTQDLQPIAARGVSLLFEGPKPVFKMPPFRCFDWFNAMNPDCRYGFDVPVDEAAERRANGLAAVRAVAAAFPKSALWDPFPLLCPGATCSAVRDGKPLFFDGDHLTPVGNAVLLDDFWRAMTGLAPRS